MIKKTFIPVLFLIILLLLLSTLKGEIGNPQAKYILKNLENTGKPFELSPERNRYAQLLSIGEYHSFFFPLELAEIVTPDLGYYNGKFVPIYPPGMTVILLPFYVFGRIFHVAQLASFSISLFAGILDLILIASIVNKLGINKVYGYLSGFLFLFATSAWAYSSTLYQHLISTAILLGIIRLLIYKPALKCILLIWILTIIATAIDYPNAFFILPLILLMASYFIRIEHHTNTYRINIKNIIFYSALICVPFLALWGFYNFQVFGKPLAISKEVTGIRKFDENDKPVLPINSKGNSNPSAFSMFSSVRLPTGLEVLLISDDRGLIWYSPYIILSFLGFSSFTKKNKKVSLSVLGSIVMLIILYSVFNDPWGGWAFGPRYLIPGFALASLFLSFAIKKYIKNTIFWVVFSILGIYSIFISLLGAITSNQVPPIREALGIAMKYNFLQNFDYLKNGISGSFIFNSSIHKYISIEIYFLIIFLICLVLFLTLSVIARQKSIKENITI